MKFMRNSLCIYLRPDKNNPTFHKKLFCVIQSPGVTPDSSIGIVFENGEPQKNTLLDDDKLRAPTQRETAIFFGESGDIVEVIKKREEKDK